VQLPRSPYVAKLRFADNPAHHLELTRQLPSTTMRRNGVHPKVISGILGHAKVGLAMDVYEHANVEGFQQPLSFIADGLL
jgi:hypothetical protein